MYRGGALPFPVCLHKRGRFQEVNDLSSDLSQKEWGNFSFKEVHLAGGEGNNPGLGRREKPIEKL